jgi:hypothetical protein
MLKKAKKREIGPQMTQRDADQGRFWKNGGRESLSSPAWDRSIGLVLSGGFTAKSAKKALIGTRGSSER